MLLLLNTSIFLTKAAPAERFVQLIQYILYNTYYNYLVSRMCNMWYSFFFKAYQYFYILVPHCFPTALLLINGFNKCCFPTLSYIYTVFCINSMLTEASNKC